MLIEIAISILFYTISLGIGLTVAPVPKKKTEKGYEPLDNQNSRQWAIFYISLVHSTISTFLMFYWYFEFEHVMVRPIYYLEEIALSHSAGYMIYDLFPHYFNGTLSIFIVWHHVAAMSILLNQIKFIFNSTLF